MWFNVDYFDQERELKPNLLTMLSGEEHALNNGSCGSIALAVGMLSLPFKTKCALLRSTTGKGKEGYVVEAKTKAMSPPYLLEELAALDSMKLLEDVAGYIMARSVIGPHL